MITTRTLYSPQLHRTVTLRIYTPTPDPSSQTTYPVGYFFDGQNLFDRETASYGMIWALDEALEALALPMIIVGLDSEESSRLEEYSPWPWQPPNLDAVLTGRGGQGGATGRFIVEDLIPWVEANYPTTDERLIGGSSLGGVMSLYLALTYPETFRHVLAMSTASWVFADDFDALLTRINPDHRQRFYIDVGTKESEDEGLNDFYLTANQHLAEVLKAAGVAHRFVIDEDARHNEDAWRKRLPDALSWLFEPNHEEVS